jgi:ubiquinone/menaquinone biosynthesis C-methylase UbiE
MGFKQKLIQKLVNQARKPTGKFGAWFAKGMNKGPHAKLAKWGLSHISIDPNYVILDVGCGGGGNIVRFAKMAVSGKVYGIDYSETSVSVSKKVNQGFIDQGMVQIYHGSVSSLPFENNFFDLVSGFETYYFWPNLIEDLKEIYRVLKSDGKLMLVNEAYISNHQNEKKQNTGEMWARAGNFKLYTPEEFNNFLSEAGFSNIEIHENPEKCWITIIGTKKTSE